MRYVNQSDVRHANEIVSITNLGVRHASPRPIKAAPALGKMVFSPLQSSSPNKRVQKDPVVASYLQASWASNTTPTRPYLITLPKILLPDD